MNLCFVIILVSIIHYFSSHVAPLHEVGFFESPKPTLTIFTILRDSLGSKKFDNKATSWLELLHTKNALVAWSQLNDTQILVFSDQEGCDLVTELQLPHTTCELFSCVHPTYQIPTYDCLFERARELSQTEFLMYSNSDIIYFDDLLKTLHFVAQKIDDFLIVGKRIDFWFPHDLELKDANGIDAFRKAVLAKGLLHGKHGIDYFIFRTRHARKLPPFLVGRIRWDNYIITEFLKTLNAKVIDATKALFAVHLNHMKVGGSHDRPGNEINTQISQGFAIDPKRIGDIEAADWILDQPCPNCQLLPNNQSLEVWLFKRGINHTIIVATVNAGYLDFALNWVCSLKRLGITNYLFHAVDQKILADLMAKGEPVIYYESAVSIKYRLDQKKQNQNDHDPPQDYGTVGYQGLMNSRTEFIYKILQKNYKVLLCDTDIVFLRNPFVHLSPSMDIIGGAHKGNKLTGGFLFLKPSDETKTIWAKVLTKHRQMFEEMQSMSTFDPHSLTEQELLNKYLQESSPDIIHWTTIPEQLLADGKRFFGDFETQKRAEWPFAIHNNYVVGFANKHRRFQNHSLWFLSEIDQSCPRANSIIPPKDGYRLVIKILTFNRPKSLARLFRSLSEVDFLQETVNLEIFVDCPDPKESSDFGYKEWEQVRDIAKRFTWTKGEKKLMIRTEHMGLVGQWLNCWFPTDEKEVALILEDDLEVSPKLYEWLKPALHHYYLNESNFDPRLFGIMTQNQHVIPGNYGKRPSELLAPNVTYYKYQLLSTWGSVFFPYHWSEFIAWYEDKSQTPRFLPLFSNLITNKWFMERKEKKSIWSTWFIRFAAERGIYALYPNNPNGASFIINHREVGENYGKFQGTNAPLALDLEIGSLQFPSSQDIPIFDFQFNQILEDPIILEKRGNYADIWNFEI